MYTYDVFVSYSHNDSSWVRGTLIPYLEQHSFRVLVDYKDFVGGRLSVDEMQRAVQDSNRTIAVLTPSYVQSEWSQFENAMAQTLDPAALSRKIVPVLHEKCDIPLRLRILHYRDLVIETDEQWQLLIRDLM